MTLLNRLLWKNLSLGQLVGFTLANIVGAVIVLAGLQAWRDIDAAMQSDGGVLSDSYLVLSKPVGGMTTLGSLMGVNPGFAEEEIAELQLQEGVCEVGRFTSAQFQVMGRVSMAGREMRTEMFLESVPSEFLDVNEGFEASFDGDFVPIIVPRTYLSLYNYGFASSQGLPQVGENIISRVSFQLQLSGRGRTKFFQARVVGFSDRLNTILVPDAFLQEANARLSTGEAETTSRIIVRTDAAEAPGNLMQYIERQGWQLEGDSADMMRLQTLLHGILAALVTLGLLVSLLAFFLLFTSLSLLIERSRRKLQDLSALGFSRRTLAWPYQKLALAVDATTWLAAALLVTFFYPRFSGLWQSVLPGFEPCSLTMVGLSALACFVAFYLFHLFLLRRQI